jgi:hypothetical protein
MRQENGWYSKRLVGHLSFQFLAEPGTRSYVQPTCREDRGSWTFLRTIRRGRRSLVAIGEDGDMCSPTFCAYGIARRPWMDLI